MMIGGGMRLEWGNDLNHKNGERDSILIYIHLMGARSGIEGRREMKAVDLVQFLLGLFLSLSSILRRSLCMDTIALPCSTKSNRASKLIFDLPIDSLPYT